MDPPAKITELLDRIDEVIGVGGSCRQFSIFAVLFVSSSRTNFEILRGKIKAQEAFLEEIN
jgi:hypothetical protein